MTPKEEITGPDRATFAWFQVGMWSLLTTTALLPGLGRPTTDWFAAGRWALGWAFWGVTLSTLLGVVLSRFRTERLKGLKAVLVTVPIALFGAAAWVLLATATEPLFGLDPFMPPNMPRDRHFVFAFLRSSFLLGFWVALFFVTVLTSRVQRAREQSLRAMAAADQAQLQLLRSQLNPHFLFNALNSVVALVGENPKAAQTMVRDVSTLLRRALDLDGKRDTTLKDELDFNRLYLKCEQVRFEEKLSVTFDVEPGVEALWVPPMVLHPLVENAIKHGMRRLTAPALVLRVSAKRVGSQLELVVTNTGTLAPAEETTSGIGLRNVRERLAQLYPERHAFEIAEKDGEVVARVSLPVKERA